MRSTARLMLGVGALFLWAALQSSESRPTTREEAEALNRIGPVWTMDLRGHGTSGGFCTLGHAEALDVAAVTAVMRAETSLPIAAIGFSSADDWVASRANVPA